MNTKKFKTHYLCKKKSTKFKLLINISQCCTQKTSLCFFFIARMAGEEAKKKIDNSLASVAAVRSFFDVKIGGDLMWLLMMGEYQQNDDETRFRERKSLVSFFQIIFLKFFISSKRRFKIG